MNTIIPLKLYVNPAWRRSGIHAVFLNPWWGNPIVEESVLAKQTFDTYSFDTACYTITDDIEEADMVFAPYRHEWFLRHDTALFNECVRTAEASGLPLLVDGTGDVDHPVAVKNVYILRRGGYRFISERERILVPAFADDLLERYREGVLDIRKKGEGKPVVGFAGWTEISAKQYIRTIIKELPVHLHGLIDSRYRACTKGIFWRQKAIRVLQRSARVLFNLRARSSFSASHKTAQGDMRTLQEEMVETILQSDYALEVRGDANDSTRLFEILSLGRIPVIIDTERNFPFTDKVDYASFALIVDFRDINRLPERIAEFHKSISPERFEQMQRNAREAYVQYFRIDALMRPIVEELRAALAHSRQAKTI